MQTECVATIIVMRPFVLFTLSNRVAMLRHLSLLSLLCWGLTVLSFATHCQRANETEPTVAPRPSVAEAPMVRAVRSLQVRGQFEPDGSALRQMHPLRIVDRPASRQHRAEEGRFRLELDYADGTRDAIRFDAYLADDSHPGRRVYGSFTVEIALREQGLPVRVTIVDVTDERTVAEWSGEELPE